MEKQHPSLDSDGSRHGAEDDAASGRLRLDFDNGQTGWVRKDEVIWLWK